MIFYLTLYVEDMPKCNRLIQQLAIVLTMNRGKNERLSVRKASQGQLLLSDFVALNGEGQKNIITFVVTT